MEIAKNNHDQYTRRNNIEIQGIPARVKDEHLENKVIDIFRCLKISIDPSDKRIAIDLVTQHLKIL